MKFLSFKELPKTYKVQGETYKIKQAKLAIKEDARAIASCDPETRTIVFRQDLTNKRELFKTLIHELLHALEFEYSLNLPHKVIRDLEEPITRFLEENF